ncbi:hypothetical protein BS78_06G017100 [Paspalum vaginatum]|nr:hypothetical protein BS78_06G017100 [Paspalum vaginatum]
MARYCHDGGSIMYSNPMEYYNKDANRPVAYGNNAAWCRTGQQAAVYPEEYSAGGRGGAGYGYGDGGEQEQHYKREDREQEHKKHLDGLTGGTLMYEGYSGKLAQNAPRYTPHLKNKEHNTKLPFTAAKAAAAVKVTSGRPSCPMHGRRMRMTL